MQLVDSYAQSILDTVRDVKPVKVTVSGDPSQNPVSSNRMRGLEQHHTRLKSRYI